MEKDKIKLSISLLSSGRAGCIRRCLASLVPLREAVSTEIIVVDTDPSHGEYVRNIVEEYADKVVPFAWCDDFAAARNAGVRECSGEWFLFIDDDEWLDDAAPIVDFLASDAAEDAQRVNVRQRNFLTIEEKEYIDAWATRMARMTDGFRFEGRIHEYFYPSSDDSEYIEAVFWHTGYAYANEEEKQAHLERNISLLEVSAKEQPYNLRWQYQLLMEYDSKGDFGRQREICEYSLGLLEDEEDAAVDNRFRGMFAAARIRIERREKNWEETARQYERMQKESRCSDVAKAYMELDGAQAYHRLGRAKEARRCCGRYLELERALRFAEKQKNEDGFYFLSETFEPHMKDLAMAVLIDCDIRSGKWDSFVRYFDRIGDEEYAKTILGTMRGEDAGSRLRAFADSCLAFYRRDVKEGLLESESGLLPDNCRLALRLERIFAKDKDDWRAVLSELKECIGIYPAMDDAVTAYSHIYAQEIKRAESQKNALSPTAEMRQIIESLQEKVEQFLAAGMIDEAEMIVRQIEQFLPERTEGKLQIYFLPYKASMWDSMESVWREAANDPGCEAHVMPVPYFDRLPGGELGDMHYEGGLFPEYVPIEDYRRVPLAIVRPDVIYFHNPYDDRNLVTMVHPDYFSSALKNECGELVYIPYCVSGYAISAKKIIASQQCPGPQNASAVVMQSEAWKRACRGHFPDQGKFLAAGSPKLDAIQQYAQTHDPSEIRRTMGIGAGRVILFNTSIAYFLQQRDWFAYAASVAEAMRESGQFLIWRPHPLLESTIASMRPQEMERFKRFVAEMEDSESVLVDRLADPRAAIVAADALISDYSSLIMQFYVTGKPLYVTETTRAIRSRRETVLAFDYFDAYFEEDMSVTDFIDMVGRGEDEKKPLREKMLAANPMLADGKAGDRIHRFVKRRYEEKNKG